MLYNPEWESPTAAARIIGWLEQRGQKMPSEAEIKAAKRAADAYVHEMDSWPPYVWASDLEGLVTDALEAAERVRSKFAPP